MTAVSFSFFNQNKPKVSSVFLKYDTRYFWSEIQTSISSPVRHVHEPSSLRWQRNTGSMTVGRRLIASRPFQEWNLYKNRLVETDRFRHTDINIPQSLQLNRNGLVSHFISDSYKLVVCHHARAISDVKHNLATLQKQRSSHKHPSGLLSIQQI
jgi:hypothetical protein